MSTDVEEKSSEEVPMSETKKNFRDRLALPVTIPIAGAVLVALLGISFSRIFLASGMPDEHATEGAGAVADHASKSTNPVLWASIITVVILVGAALISAARSMRPLSFKLIISGTVLVVILTGAIIYGSGEPVDTGVVPGVPTAAELATADPANVIEVDALGTLMFDKPKYSLKPGVAKIRYIGKGGSHQLKFSGKFDWFDLAVSEGTEEDAEINLEPGEYVIYCPIAGHESMKATITVAP